MSSWGSSSGAGGASRVEAASAGADTTTVAPVTHATTVPTTVAPAPTPDTTPAPAPTADTTPTAPSTQDVPVVAPPTDAPVQPAAPSTFTLSGSVTGNPAGTHATITLSGAGGTFSADVAADGSFSISGLPAGDYQAIGQWTDDTGTATAASRFGTVSVTGDTSVTFSF